MQELKEETNNNEIVIIGAGPAGLTAAYELSKAGVESVVLEKDNVIGGISRTVNYKDYYFDIGGHRFFTKIKEVEDIWNEMLGEDFLHRKRLSRIYYNKKFFYYPLRPANVLSKIGFKESVSIIMSYFYSRIFPSRQEITFEEWVSNRFGKRLYETFFKSYTEKVLGIPCHEIKAEWAKQRIKGLSLTSIISNTMNPQNNGSNGDVVKTLIDSFNYPKFGPGMMWDAIAKAAQDKSEICLGAEVEKIVLAKNRIESLEISKNNDKECIRGTHYISSMPLRELVQKFEPAAPEEIINCANKLKYRDFIIVALIVNKKDVFKDNWIYIHDSDVKLGRIQNFKNWSPFMVPDQSKTLLGLEYFCFEGDELWNMPDKKLIELGKGELEKLGLLQTSDVEDGTVVKVPKAYPIYDSGYRESLQPICQFLNKIDNMQVIGRNGMHKYNNQDHSMLTAMLAVENILGANHDLCKVNTDCE